LRSCVLLFLAMAEDEEKVDKSMATLSNRLPFMELSDICEQENFLYAAVWRPSLSKHSAQRSENKPVECLTCDVRASHGEYAATLVDVEVSSVGATYSKCGEMRPGETLPWKCFKSERGDKVEFFDNVASSNDPRKAELKAAGVRGSFAIFRDGAVYEFGQASHMENEPEQLIKGIGGSTGVVSAAKAVQAVVRLGNMAKKSKAAEGK